MKRGSIVFALLLAVGFASHCSRKEEPVFREQEDVKRKPQEWLRFESVRILRDYVRIDTRLERGEEEGARFLENLFSCAGIQTEIVCPAPRRCNLLARIPGRTRQGALLLLNHIDVARVLPEYWKEATPFSGEVKNGFLYGRGSYDMKSTAVAQALALRSLKEHGIVPGSDVLFLAEADEETSQVWGSQWLLEHRPEWFAGVAQVLNEGGVNETVLRSVRDWGLETLQAGFHLIEFEGTGEEPLKTLSARWQKLEAEPVEPDPQVRMAFDRLANHLVHPLTDPLRHLDRVIRNPKELSALPNRYGSLLEPRIYWSPPYPHTSGSKKAVRIFFFVSTPPGVSPDTFAEAIRRDGESRGLSITEEISSGVTTASPYPTPFTELLRVVTGARFPGIPFGPMPTYGGMSTSILFRRRAIPAYGYTPFVMNNFDAVRRHGSDERIYLRDYLNGVSLFQDVVEAFAFADQEMSSRAARSRQY